MLSVLTQSLLLAAGGILSVGSITIVILLLISDRGWRNGLAYALGYISGYSLIGCLAVLLGANASPNEASSSGIVSSILLILLGVLLLWMAWRNWLKPQSEDTQPPRFFAMVNNITQARAFAFGVAVTVINFKNLAIFLSAVSVVMLSDLLLPVKIGIALLDVLVFCAAVIAPVFIYLAFPNNARQRLNDFKQMLETYSRPIGIWVPLLFAVIFILRGISALL